MNKPTFMQAGKKCPLNGKKCVEFDCAWATHVVGQNPQDGSPVNSYGCAVPWLPILMVEVGRRSAGVQAATEDLRNHVHRMGEDVAEPVRTIADLLTSAAPRGELESGR